MQSLNVDNIVQRPFWSLVYSVAYPLAEPEAGEPLPRLWLMARALAFVAAGVWLALMIICIVAGAALLGRYPAIMGRSDGHLFSRYWLPHINGIRFLPIYILPLIALMVWPHAMFHPDEFQDARTAIGGVVTLMALAGGIAALVRMSNCSSSNWPAGR
ncbi:MAG TPA: hypothetical protein VGE35_01035 [Candidatus Paceibacterota bacterium]